jgi:hypothetical protein
MVLRVRTGTVWVEQVNFLTWIGKDNKVPQAASIPVQVRQSQFSKAAKSGR